VFKNEPLESALKFDILNDGAHWSYTRMLLQCCSLQRSLSLRSTTTVALLELQLETMRNIR
jgi:hypothetical protein